MISSWLRCFRGRPPSRPDPASPGTGWLVPQGSIGRARRSPWPGPSRGRLLWHFALPENAYIKEPLVTASGEIIVNSNGEPYELTMLSQAGSVMHRLPLHHPPWSNPCIGSEGTIVGSGWDRLFGFASGGTLRWEARLPGFVKYLTPTPDGDLLAFTGEKGFERWTFDGNSLGSAYPGLGRDAFDEMLLAFDKEGNLYVAQRLNIRFSPDEDVEEHRAISAWDPAGRRRWGRNLDGTVEHIWARQNDAVFFADSRIECCDWRANILWAISGPSDFEREMDVKKAGVRLACDSRLAGAPQLLRLVANRWERVDCAIDADGNMYFCVAGAVVSIGPRFEFRWRVSLPDEHLSNPVAAPGQLLVCGYHTVYAVG